MTLENSSLPDNVLEALHRGDTIEAIRRLCAATGLGLKESMDVIDGHLRGRRTAFNGASSNRLPAAVVEALQRGDKIGAIKLLRKQTGLGLKEAKDAVDIRPQPVARTAGHRPAAERSGAGLIWWMAGLALAGYAIYHLLGCTN